MYSMPLIVRKRGKAGQLACLFLYTWISTRPTLWLLYSYRCTLTAEKTCLCLIDVNVIVSHLLSSFTRFQIFRRLSSATIFMKELMVNWLLHGFWMLCLMLSLQVGQILMIQRQWEQYIFWIALDIDKLLMFSGVAPGFVFISILFACTVSYSGRSV